MSECASCKHSDGDCGNHHVDFEGKVHLDIPGLPACDRYDQCMFWERSNDSRRKEINEQITLIIKALSKIQILESEIATVEKQDKEEQKRKFEEEKEAQTMIFECKLGEFKKIIDDKESSEK